MTTDPNAAERASTEMDDTYWPELVEVARANVAQLPAASPTRATASDAWFNDLASQVPLGNEAPPLLLHLRYRDLPALLAFDDDIRTVEDAHPLDGEARSFLTVGREHTVEAGRQWLSATFELAVQAQLLEWLGPSNVDISPVLPNGRRADAAFTLGDRRIWIEISALSDSDQLIETFDTTAAVQLVHGDPYKDAQRVYQKVCDKACGPPSDLRSQLHPSEPSIVMVGDAAWRSPGFEGKGFCWALEQLTDLAPRSDTSRASFLTWADHRYGRDAKSALARLASLSAISVSGYDRRLSALRPSLVADETHRLTTDEIDALTDLLAVERLWLPRRTENSARRPPDCGATPR